MIAGAGAQIGLDRIPAGQLLSPLQGTVDEHVDSTAGSLEPTEDGTGGVEGEVGAGSAGLEGDTHPRGLRLAVEQQRVGEPLTHRGREAVHGHPGGIRGELGGAAHDVEGQRVADHAVFSGSLE